MKALDDEALMKLAGERVLKTLVLAAAAAKQQAPSQIVPFHGPDDLRLTYAITLEGPDGVVFRHAGSHEFADALHADMLKGTAANFENTVYNGVMKPLMLRLQRFLARRALATTEPTTAATPRVWDPIAAKAKTALSDLE